MLTFVKFGGSVITDKQGHEAPDAPLIARLAAEVAAARHIQPELQLILSHGSGSFGHVYAARYGIHKGLPASSNWIGFARTADAAARLNRIVVAALLACDVPTLTLQPSASALAQNGILQHWETATLTHALTQRLVPLVYGDVAFDSAQGSAIISTEQLLAYLCQQPALQPQRIVLVGEAAVYTADPRREPQAAPIAQINVSNIEAVLHGSGGSHGVDVTGGMHNKITLMWSLVQRLPQLEVVLIGPQPGLLTQALSGHVPSFGTIIRRGTLLTL
ncbi:uridylate kinase [Candidatus Gracilibacteria bacterium]|nr:uridylate kinase [Candidatus Gracilibacteria bacterium]